MLPGIFTLPWWGYLAVALTFTHITIAGVTTFLHRHQAHRALEMHPVASHFFRFWLWLTTSPVVYRPNKRINGLYSSLSVAI